MGKTVIKISQNKTPGDGKVTSSLSFNFKILILFNVRTFANIITHNAMCFDFRCEQCLFVCLSLLFNVSSWLSVFFHNV